MNKNNNEIAEHPINILFICSKNQWRSPTAETIYQEHPQVNARSAGTANSSKRKVSLRDLEWADLLIVMEEKHLSRLREEYRNHTISIKSYVLDIPDEYGYMDPDLISELRNAVDPIIEELGKEDHRSP